MTEVHECEQLAHICYLVADWPRFELCAAAMSVNATRSSDAASSLITLGFHVSRAV